MAATQHRPDPLIDDGSSHLLLEVGRAIRDNAPTLFAMSIVSITLALPWIVLASATSWLAAWFPLLVVIAPIWAAIVAASETILVGDAMTLRTFFGLVRRHAVTGWRIGIVPAVSGGLLLALFEGIDRNPDTVWLPIPLFMVAGVSLTVAILTLPAFVFAARGSPSGIAVWQESARTLLASPMPILGCLVLAGMVLWLTLAIGPAALLAVAPLAVLICAVADSESA